MTHMDLTACFRDRDHFERRTAPHRDEGDPGVGVGSTGDLDHLPC